MEPPNREHLDEIWQGIVRYDALPVARLSIDDPEAHQRIREFFDQYAGHSVVWVDSENVTPRPLRVSEVTADHYITLHRPQIEFVVVRDGDPTGFRAITEEEYEWHLYADAGYNA